MISTSKSPSAVISSTFSLGFSDRLLKLGDWKIPPFAVKPALPPVRSKLTFVSPSVNSPSPTPTSSPMPGTPAIGSLIMGIS